jgi:hypothetical protein
MMFDTPNLATSRKEVFEMTAPPGWVLAIAVAPRRCPIKDALDPTAHPARGFRLCRPNWLDCFHDEPNIAEWGEAS